MAVACDTSLTCKVAPDDPILMGRVEVVAKQYCRPAGPLRLQALLQLPRVADCEGSIPVATAERLLQQLVRELPAAEEWRVGEHVSSPRALAFGEVGHNEAAFVMQRFHYLRSPRSDASAYGLSTETGRLVAMCTTSPVDVSHLRHLLLKHGRRHDHARVVSRVFAFEGTPKNTISYLLARVIRAERPLGISDYLTYVNPNLGFTGGSYHASGWHVLGNEPGTKYRYLDSSYISDRRLTALFGSLDDTAYTALLGSRFSVSRMPLAPLLVFHRQPEA
jgi:hypothetical protein